MELTSFLTSSQTSAKHEKTMDVEKEQITDHQSLSTNHKSISKRLILCLTISSSIILVLEILNSLVTNLDSTMIFEIIDLLKNNTKKGVESTDDLISRV